MLIDFTDEEALALNRIIDLAVRQAGLQIAAVALTINNKLVAALNERQLANGGVHVAGTDLARRPHNSGTSGN